MKRFVFAAFAACFAMPAMAQNWDGSPTTPATITVSGKSVSTEIGQAQTYQYSLVCEQIGGVGLNSLFSGPCSSSQLSSGYRNSLAPVIIGSNGAGNSSVPAAYPSSLPVGIASPGSTVSIYLQGVYKDSSAPSGYSSFFGSIPLQDFSSAAEVQALSDKLNRQRQLSYRGIAMASSLSLAEPAPGRSNRLAVGAGSFAGEGALSVNYTHRSGDVDFGLAFAAAGKDGLGKANLGVSW